MQKELAKHRDLSRQEEIIRAIKQNDDPVLKHLYQSNYAKVEQYVLKNRGSEQQAKDIYQEAFIVMWKNIQVDKFVPKGETAIQGYLYTIARNKWMDYVRSAYFKKTVSAQEEKALDQSLYQAELESPEENPFMNTVLGAFSELGADCKQLLNYFYFDKKSLKEIASILNIGAASVRNKKYRCMQSLRALAQHKVQTHG